MTFQNETHKQQQGYVSKVSGGKRAGKNSTQAAETMKDSRMKIQRPTQGRKEEGGKDYRSLRV